MLSEGQFLKLTADGAVDPIPGQEQKQQLESPGLPAPGPGSALWSLGSLLLGA